MFYLAGNSVIQSNIHLPELTQLASADASSSNQFISFSLVNEELPSDGGVHWYRHIPGSSDDQTWLSLGLDSTFHEYWLYFTNLAYFIVSKDGTRIRLYLLGDVEFGQVSENLLDYVIPYAIGLDNKLVLHGVGSLIFGIPTLFLAGSKSGKSTLLATLGFRGHEIIADDSIILEKYEGQYRIHPYTQGISLRDESYNHFSNEFRNYDAELQIFDNGRYLSSAEGTFSLRIIYILERDGGIDSEHISFHSISPSSAFIALQKYTLNVDLNRRERYEHYFQHWGQIVDSIPFFQLDYPREYSMLDRVVDEIIEHTKKVCI